VGLSFHLTITTNIPLLVIHSIKVFQVIVETIPTTRVTWTRCETRESLERIDPLRYHLTQTTRHNLVCSKTFPRSVQYANIIRRTKWFAHWEVRHSNVSLFGEDDVAHKQRKWLHFQPILCWSSNMGHIHMTTRDLLPCRHPNLVFWDANYETKQRHNALHSVSHKSGCKTLCHVTMSIVINMT
jgi:hypothetical protein